jgi:hypothetical protein
MIFEAAQKLFRPAIPRNILLGARRLQPAARNAKYGVIFPTLGQSGYPRGSQSTVDRRLHQ